MPEITALPVLPAPVWFLMFFKALGTLLHFLMMHLWLVGLPVAALCLWRGGDSARVWARRFVRQLPFILALGINFGIVPLLFIQVIYPKAFYPATILMAWWWIAIIVMLIPAYYGVYLYAGGISRARATGKLPRYAVLAGGAATLLFLVIGFIFVNALTLTAQPGSWTEVWLAHETAGAATGFGNALLEPTLWPRLAMNFGLALLTTGAWVLADRTWLYRDPTPEYSRWTGRLAALLGTLGVVVFGLAGGHYLFRAIGPEMTRYMLSPGQLPATVCAGVGAALSGLTLVVVGLSRKPGAVLGTVPFCVQFLALAANVVARQFLQSRELHAVLPWDEMPVQAQWSPIVLFLGSFVLGAVVIVWMVRAAVKSAPH